MVTFTAVFMHVKEQIEPFDKTAKSYNLFWDNGNTSFTVFELKTSVHPPLFSPMLPFSCLLSLSEHFEKRHDSEMKLNFNRVFLNWTQYIVDIFKCVFLTARTFRAIPVLLSQLPAFKRHLLFVNAQIQE